MDDIIIAKNIRKTFIKDKNIKIEVLKGIDLSVKRGDFLALLGPSGAGKTTLLYVLSSLDLPDDGTVEYNFGGEKFELRSLSSEKLAKIRNRHIGFVFQFHHLLPEFTALENVAIPLLIRNENTSKAFELAKEMLIKVGLGERLNHKPTELSGGEQQRVAIARALVTKPDIVFADEPTGNLDTATTQKFLDLLKSLKKEITTTLIVATHSNEVAQTADRIIQIKDGKIF